ncbi:MAG: transposase [Planctomycetaceae bacterium]|nr:transposase [Planctomycetaceae bacterium]
MNTVIDPIGSFNGRVREECLNLHRFTTLAEAQWIIEHWRIDDNQRRPHSSLKYSRIPLF